MILAASYSFAQGKGSPVKAFQWTPKATELRLAMRSLWEGHIFWVRNVVLTTKLGDTAAAKTEEDQVVRNARQIANAVVPYYGKDAGEKLFNLLAGHYGAIKDCMNAVYSGNKKAEEAAMAKMTKNADEIATFLSSANPNWPKTALLSALAAHGGYHMAQINAIHAKDFSSEAKTWEAMKDQVYGIADTLTEGIVKQFPQRFGEPTV
ncbi:MAG: hypothetical protein ACE144_20945 [Thermodesulfobacteriota bacterium]